MSTGLALNICADVATVTLVDPRGLHLLGTQTLLNLDNCLAELCERRDLKAIVLTADGWRTFSAGADLSEVCQLNPTTARAFSELGQGVAKRLASAPVVTVALLNASAFGGGVELALACDLRVMVTSACLHYQAPRLGILPGWGGTQRLPLIIGQARARQMLLQCEPVDATQALAWGLIAMAVPSIEASEWYRLLDSLRQNDARAVANIKRALQQFDSSAESVEQDAFAACFETRSTQARIAAWLNRTGQ